MDPLSIAGTVVGLTATCLSTCKKLSDLAGSYEDVPVVIAMLCSESTVISVALSQLQILVLQRSDLSQAWASETDILNAFEMSLNGCMIVFSCLEAETRELQLQLPKSTGRRVWTKIKFMWNQDRLKELLTSLRGQQSSLNFLLQVLECKTLSEILHNVSANKSRLQASASDAQSLRSRNPSVRTGCQSVFDNDAHRLSMFADDLFSVVAAPSEINFEFDDFVLNSQAYRRVFAKAQAERTQEVHVQNITGDLIDFSENVRDDADAETIRDFHQDLAGLNLGRQPSTIQRKPVQGSNDSQTSLAVPPNPADIRSNQTSPLPASPSPSSSPRPRSPRVRVCFRCHEPVSGQFVRALAEIWHLNCFTCADCNQIVATKFFPSTDDPKKPLCEKDYFQRLDLLCHSCDGPLRGNYIKAVGRKYHLDHFGCETCSVKFGADDSYYEHGGRTLCFRDYCRAYASLCQGCSWPILAQFVELDEGRQEGTWHPECYLLAKHLSLKVQPTAQAQNLLDSLDDDKNEDATREYNDAHLLLIKRVWEQTSSFLDFFSQEATSALECGRRADHREAFRHWNLMTAQTNSLFEVVGKYVQFVDPKHLAWFDSQLQAYCAGFSEQSAGKLDTSARDKMTLAIGPLLRSALEKLLSYDDRHKADSRIELFLQELCEPLGDPPKYATEEPNADSLSQLNCRTCNKLVKTTAYGLGLGHSTLFATRWHVECWRCMRCGGHQQQSPFDAATLQLISDPSSILLKCRDCEYDITMKKFEAHEAMVEIMWGSWSLVKQNIQSAANRSRFSISLFQKQRT